MGKVDLNENILCAYRLSKGHISNIFRTPCHVKMKLSGNHEGGSQITKRQNIDAITAIIIAATTVTTATKTTLLLLLLLILRLSAGRRKFERIMRRKLN